MSTDIPWLPDDPVAPVAPPVIAPDKHAAPKATKDTARPPKQARKRVPVTSKGNGGHWYCVVCGPTKGGEDSECPACGTERTLMRDPEPVKKPEPEPQVPSRHETTPEAQATAVACAPLDIRKSWAVPPPARQWLVSGWLPHGRVAMLAGRGAAGKSQIMLQLAYAIACDLPNGNPRTWFEGGPSIEGGQGTTVFATWEDSSDEILRRQLANPDFSHSGAPEFDRAVSGRFNFVDLAGAGPLWTTGASHQSYGELTPIGASLRAACQALGTRLLVIDALSSAYAGNENERPAVRAFLSSWDRWARDNNCVVILVAHPPKSDGQDSFYSGSTDWRAGVRSLLVLSRPKGVADRAKLVCDKLNSAPTPNPFALASPRWWAAIDVDPLEIDDADRLEMRESIVDALKEHGPLNRSKIRATLHKGKTAVDDMLAKMELDRSLVMTKDGNAKIYSLGNPEAPINPEPDIPF